MEKGDSSIETATLGGGCFWCTEAVFLEIAGVVDVKPGYSGGHTKNPTYQQVTTGRTGHAEVVQIKFRPGIISYREILEIFFTMHDPTTLNSQGADIGSQYRSVIFYHSEKQRKVAKEFIEELEESNVFNVPIVTQLELFKEFYEAEDYHKNYYQRNRGQAYSRHVIAPKLEKIERVQGEDQVMVETAKYDVMVEDGEFEVRRYHKMLVATVSSPVGSKFNRLFQYISGSNKSRSKIAMTSPVITSEKIEMTAPVLSTEETMSFVVPSKYDGDTVPEPADPAVSIDEVPERYVATIRFRGLAWKNVVDKKTRKLFEWLSGEGIMHKGTPFLMQYNPPYVPGFLRRNEVGVEVEYLRGVV